LLIDRESLATDFVLDELIKPGAEVHFVPQEGRQFLPVTKEPKASASTGFQFDQHIQVADPGIKIVAQDRSEEAQLANTSSLAKLCDLRPIDLNGQLGCAHGAKLHPGFRDGKNAVADLLVPR
jgi:hypothetical protein